MISLIEKLFLKYCLLGLQVVNKLFLNISFHLVNFHILVIHLIGQVNHTVKEVRQNIQEIYSEDKSS